MEIVKNISGFLLLKKKLITNELFRNSKLTLSSFDDQKIDILLLKKGEKLYRLKDPSLFIYLVIEGEIKLLKKHSFGKTPAIMAKNDFFGHEDYFLKAKKTSAAFATANSVVARLSKENIDMLLSRDILILNIIRESINGLDPSSKSELEKILNELSNPDEQPSASELNPSAPPAAENDYLSAVKENPAIDVNTVCSGINQIVNSISENLSHLDNEKNKMAAAISDYESKTKDLLNKIKKLEELEKNLKASDEEKNEMLESRNCTINELEEEIAKYKGAQSENLKKIDSLSDLDKENKNNIKFLEAELSEKNAVISKYEAEAAEKESILSGIENNLREKETLISGLEKELEGKIVLISKLQDELDRNLKAVADLNEERLKLLSQKEDQEKQAGMKTELEDLKKRIDSLNIDLAGNEKNLAGLTAELEKKNLEISGHNEELGKAEAEIIKLKQVLGNKDEGIQSLSALVEELQKQIDEKETDIEKKEALINSQSSKMSGYEESLSNLKVEVTRKQQFINNFIEEIGELSASVWQKQSEIQEQNKIISEFQKKMSLANDISQVFINNEEELRKINSELNSERDASLKMQNELTKIRSDTQEYKNTLKEKESLIENQNEKFEDLKHTNSMLTSSLNSLSGIYEKEIKRKDSQIAELKEKIEKMERPPGKKASFEMNRTETIKGPEKTTGHSASINNSENTINNSKTTKNLLRSAADKEIYSKCKLVSFSYADKYSPERSFEHLQYSAVDIINVNCSRATMDVATAFNKFLEKIITRERNKIVINLLNCEYMDTSILGVLINSLKKAMSFKGILVLVWQHQKEFSMLSLSKMNNIFRIFPSLQNALNSLS